MTKESKALWKQRVKLSLATLGCLVVPVVPLYTAFVVQNLWNWFVADALHAAEISYWQSLGILIAIFVVRHEAEKSYDKEIKSERLYTMIEALLPEEKRTEFHESFKIEDESWAATLAAVNPMMGKAISNTIAIAVGWGVHTFLM
jgi:hypothetical protein